MSGVPRDLTEHAVNVYKGMKLIKQTLRCFAKPKRKAIGKEIARLLVAGFIREVKHSDWLANPVLVPKKNKILCMCVDFTDLNKACPKDYFPLSRIEQIVDSTAGCKRFCFLDAYSGYH